MSQTFDIAREKNTRPMAVSILDAGGHTVVSAREDSAAFGRLELAHAKAWGALSLGMGTRTLSERAQAAPTFFTSAVALFKGKLILAPGGLLLTRDTSVIGAIGVSGDTGDSDELCAVGAAEFWGLSFSR